MIAENSDRDALVAQADIHRLYVKVVQPSLAEFVPTEDVSGEQPTLDAFLEGARTNTHNAICYEMRRAFSLILGALFERQLRFWLMVKLPTQRTEIEKALWPKLLALIDTVDCAIRKNAFMDDIQTLYLVANVVRHGTGRSSDELQKASPRFWKRCNLMPQPNLQSDLVGNMRIENTDLERFATAAIKFWHLAGASSLP